MKWGPGQDEKSMRGYHAKHVKSDRSDNKPGIEQYCQEFRQSAPLNSAIRPVRAAEKATRLAQP